MPLSWDFSPSIDLGGSRKSAGGHINRLDAHRQTATAREILQLLRTQPGVVLADEVGMGKTYVALAVVASVLEAERRSGRPVVVMVPPGLAVKWRREWVQFKSVCADGENAFGWVRDAYVHTPAEFFKLLDDPADKRAHLIWMTTSCFQQGFTDRWMKLAFIRAARSKTRMDDSMKRRLYKWATSLVRLKQTRMSEEDVERLLTAELGDWKRILVKMGQLKPEDDDPIPEQLIKHIDKLDFTDVIAVMRGESLPWRKGVALNDRLAGARNEFNEACSRVYGDWLQLADWRAPLLVLDEAHHAKNDGTRLASLFRSEETSQLVGFSSDQEDKPLLWEKFDRMLFLTATPFQLGHHELIRILRSFAAAAWRQGRGPDRTRHEFLESIGLLHDRLDINRQFGKRLDEWWGKLNRDRFGATQTDEELLQAVEAWWARAKDRPADALEQDLVRAVTDCIHSKSQAEYNPEDSWRSLRTWVIRHNRATTLPEAEGKPIVSRREKQPGAKVLPSSQSGSAGLPLAHGSALPFLLAVRAQGELAAGSAKARAFFAEGLCSSYEAFHHTRAARGDARDMDDDGAERVTQSKKRDKVPSLVPIEWYEEQVERFIPKDSPEELYSHPKIRPVVERAVSLWGSGEKVLIFCFYRETAKALLNHLKNETERYTLRTTAEKLGIDPADEVETRQALNRIVRRLSEESSPFHGELVAFIERLLAGSGLEVLQEKKGALTDMLVAYVRSPAFLSRYLPLDLPYVRDALAEGVRDPALLQRGATAFIEALENRSDGSNVTLRQRIEQFLEFAKELAERSQTRAADDEGEIKTPLEEYMESVAVYSSARRSKDDDDPDARTDDGSFRAQPVVRMVYGDTARSVRERLMQAFNSPLFPEILVTSGVLGEGVDLHRFCRHVIHHDLCWNPSTLEQRTGRLDRIRCKAEYSHQPIVIFEPYIGGSADEKMYRVVQDRERWFQVVMGQKFEFDEGTSEKIANRVPLPEALAKSLVFDLRVWKETSPSR